MCLSRPRLCCKAARAKNCLQVQRIAWCLQGSLFVYPEASEVVYQQRELLTQNQHLWSAAGRGCVRCHDSENNRSSLVRVSGRHSCMWSVSLMFTVKENVSRPLQPFFLPSISTAVVLPLPVPLPVVTGTASSIVLRATQVQISQPEYINTSTPIPLTPALTGTRTPIQLAQPLWL